MSRVSEYIKGDKIYIGNMAHLFKDRTPLGVIFGSKIQMAAWAILQYRKYSREIKP